MCMYFKIFGSFKIARCKRNHLPLSLNYLKHWFGLVWLQGHTLEKIPFYDFEKAERKRKKHSIPQIICFRRRNESVIKKGDLRRPLDLWAIFSLQGQLKTLGIRGTGQRSEGRCSMADSEFQRRALERTWGV